MTDLERLAKPYLLNGKRHSVRTLHTALSKICGERGRLSFDENAAYIRGNAITYQFARTFDADGNSIIATTFTS